MGANQQLLAAYTAAAGGFTLADSSTETATATGSDRWIGGYASLSYRSIMWTAGSSYTLIKAVPSLFKNGAPTGNLTCYVYTNSAGVPGTLVATSSNTIDVTTLTTSEALYSFLFAGASITSGTVYHLVISLTGGTANDPDHAFWTAGNTYDSTSCAGTTAGAMAADGTPPNYCLVFKTYK